MAILSITEGPAIGQRFALEEHRLVLIGRDEKCTFQILDPQISRRHLQIKRDAATGGHLAIDYNSANGVFVNGHRIEAETPLANGDTMKIGETTLLYVNEDAPDAQHAQEGFRKLGERRQSTIVGRPDQG